MIQLCMISWWGSSGGTACTLTACIGLWRMTGRATIAVMGGGWQVCDAIVRFITISTCTHETLQWCLAFTWNHCQHVVLVSNGYSVTMLFIIKHNFYLTSNIFWYFTSFFKVLLHITDTVYVLVIITCSYTGSYYSIIIKQLYRYSYVIIICSPLFEFSLIFLIPYSFFCYPWKQ